MMIEVLCKENIEEVLMYPQHYIDDTQDVALLRIINKDGVCNPTYIMVGQDEQDERYYLVVEDNDSSEDYYPEDSESLLGLYEKLLDECISE